MSGQQTGPAGQAEFERHYADPQRAFENAMENLQRGQERLSSVRRQLDDKPVKVTSTDGMISITLDGAGEVKQIAFNTGKWRRMAPAELGAALVQALSRAREQSRAQLAEAYRSLLPAELDPAKLMSGEFSLDSIFKTAREQSAEYMDAAKAATAQIRKGMKNV